VSGYLHGLACRALRRTAPLHSVAILPFANAPSHPPQEEESRVAIRPAAADLKGDAANRPARAEGGPMRGPTGRDAPDASAPEPLLPPPATLPASLARTRPPADNSDITPRSTAAAARERGHAPTGGERHGISPGASPPREVASPRAARVPHPISVASRRAAAMPATQGPRPVRAVETATEVHLSIGRVEVAVLAQTPAPKEARPRARTMSLAEYEQRRRERER